MHLTDAQLRDHIDNELNESDAVHLESCPACRTRLETIAARSVRVASQISALAPTPLESPRAVQSALALLKDKQRKENTPMINKLFSKQFRTAWVALATVATLAIALTLPPVQAWATNFLGLFRVKQIEVVQIDPSRLSELNNDETLGERMGQMFSNSFKVTKESGQPQTVSSAAEASELAGFTVRLPGSRSDTPQLTIQGSTAFEFTVDRALAQAILNDAGFSDTQLPESLDGAPIAVSIPASVSAAYGGCPRPAATEADREDLQWEELRTCLILAQIPSPTVNAPTDLDIARLAEIGLQFAGMSPTEAQQLSQTIDWSSTLVVPIPRNAASVEEVTVDGVAGTLLRRYPDDGVPDRYVLLWVKDDIIYALSGFGQAETALEIANSMK